MGAPRKPFDLDAAVRAYNDGASLREIADAQDCVSSTVRTRLTEAGVEIRGRGGRRDKAVAGAHTGQPSNYDSPAARPINPTS